MRNKLIKVHSIAATVALLMITTFFICTLISELSGDKSFIVSVKVAVFYAIWFLIPLMIITGITGQKLAPNAKSGVIGRKKKRMPFIAINGIFILVPAASYLKVLAVGGDFNSTFYIVQSIEIVAGLVNITLMSLNLKDGLSLRKPKRLNQ